MDYHQIERDLSNVPSIKLLKSPHAPLVLSFLYQLFKLEEQVSIPLDEVVERLERYLERFNERQPGAYLQSAKAYLTEWARVEHQYIHISFPHSLALAEVELTSHTERTIGWLEELHQQHFVGTESRFLHLIQLLHDMVERSTEDPALRLAQLEAQYEALGRQIEVIRQTQVVDDRFTPTQLKERFTEACQMARQLLRDFHRVEDTFQEIALTLQKAQLQAKTSKGALVSYVLTADEELKSSDQGRSFYAFWRFLMAPSQQDEFSRLLESVQHLGDIQPVAHEGQVLQHLPLNQLAAGQRVVQSNVRMAEQLRRLLDEQSRGKRARLRELLVSIKRDALVLAAHPPGDEIFATLEGPPHAELGMERELWEPAETLTFDAQPSLANQEDLADVDLSRLYTQFTVDTLYLRERMESLLAQRSPITLAEVLTSYPPEKGLSEIVAYCVIAASDQRHEIHPELGDRIRYRSAESGRTFTMTVPRILYRSHTNEK